MKPSIPTRLFLAVLSACAVVLAVNGVAERFSFERVFLQYLNEQGMQRMQQLATVVAGEYRSHGSWDFMRADPDEWFWNRILPRLVEHVSPPGTTAVPAGHAGSRPEAPAMGASTTRGADTPTAGGTDAPMTKGMDAPAADVASASTKGAEDVPAAGGTKASAAGVTKAPAVEATDAPATGGPYGPEDAPEPPLSDLAGVMLRMALMDTQGRLLMGNPAAATPRGVRLPVRVDGQTVGWLSMLPLEKAVERSDVRFYEAQQRARWLNIAASIAVAALLAWLLSRALLSRLKVLAGGIRRLARGDYGSRLPAGSDDELGRLRDDVNHLAQVLERTEESRRDFMADISHELRTPLAVLRAELEAMQDGIRPLTPDGLQAVQGPVQQLGKLVEDLHELSMAQAEVSYQREPLDVGAVLVQALAGMASRLADAGLQLQRVLPASPLPVLGEARRLEQVFVNLLENAARYTDAGGQVRVVARTVSGRQVEIVVEDSAPGVPADRRVRLFERFYRVDSSRARARGGSGLGLAICQHIVQAHRGTITADDSPLGGLRITVTLPLQP